MLIITFFTSSDLGFRTKRFYLQFLVDTLTLGTGSVDPHFFADPDSGSQHIADPYKLKSVSLRLDC